MALREHYLIAGSREAVTPYLFGRLLGIEHALYMLGIPLDADSAVYCAEAEDAQLIRALRTAQVKAAASNGSQSLLLPPSFWKIGSCALNAFTKGVVDAPDGTGIPGLRDVQGWRVVFDEASFEGWRYRSESRAQDVKTNSLPVNSEKRGKGRPKGSGGHNDECHLTRIHQLVQEGHPVSRACEVVAADVGIADRELKSVLRRWRRKYSGKL